MSKVTVSILTYNSAKTIRQCLDALVAQSDDDFSVHIIDDASSDNTMDIVGQYTDRLKIKTFQNGTHNIPHGRNIALQNVQEGICAFTDSDDTVDINWVTVIRRVFDKTPSLAMIAGTQVTSYRTRFAKATAANDETMRSLFGGGVLQFCTCNCAINRDVLKDMYFNELFKNGEDIEFASRVEKSHSWKFVTELIVYHSTRDTVSSYNSQMYLYGKWKLLFAYATKTFRIVDFIPIGYGLFCLLLGLIYPLFIIAILLLPIAQTSVTILKQRPQPSLWVICFFAWCIKNVSWSIGIVSGLTALGMNSAFRVQLRKEVG